MYVYVALSSALVELSDYRSQVGISGDTRLVNVNVDEYSVHCSEWIPRC